MLKIAEAEEKGAALALEAEIKAAKNLAGWGRELAFAVRSISIPSSPSLMEIDSLDYGLARVEQADAEWYEAMRACRGAGKAWEVAVAPEIEKIGLPSVRHNESL